MGLSGNNEIDPVAADVDLPINGIRVVILCHRGGSAVNGDIKAGGSRTGYDVGV